MSTSIELKNQVIEKIKSADDKLLLMIKALVESYQEEEMGVSEMHKEILEERLKFHQENPQDGKSWEEIKVSIMQEYGL